MSNYRRQLIELIKEHGTPEREEAVELSSGDKTNVYLDIPSVLSTGPRLRLASTVIAEWIELHVPDPITAIGAPQTGADALVGVVASRRLQGWAWFTVRKEFKSHGIPGWIQGASLTESDRVVLIDDVVSTGRSLKLAAEKVLTETGNQVVAIIPLVDRAGLATGLFEAAGIPYWPVITHLDLDIDPLIQSQEVL